MKSIHHPLILLGCMLMLSTAGCSKKEEVKEIIRPVRTLRVSDTSHIPGRIFPGRSEAVLAVDIAFEVPGRLIERPILVGDNVTKGQTLAKLDPRDYANAVDASKARLKQSKAYLDRIVKAFKAKAVSEQDLTDAQAQFEVAEADLKIKQKALADTEIIATFDGTIAAIYVENHQNVRSKQAIVRVMDITTLEMRVDIPEKLISLIHNVADISITFDAFPNRPVSATVKEIGKEASATTRTFPVTLAMNQPADFTILPGMTGQAAAHERISADAIDVIQIPGEAVFEETGKKFVWAVDESSMAVKRIEVTPTTVNRQGVLVQGLDIDQLIVTAGVHNLSEGQTVRLLGEN
jgi:RND family efflux transporter MFP subunit